MPEQPGYLQGWYVLNDEGHPVPAMNDKMREGFWESPMRIIGREERTVDGITVLVSTIFLGLNHNFDPDGPPILWETMVFNGELDQEMERYSSQEAAQLGHTYWVEQVFGDAEHESLEAFAARVNTLIAEVQQRHRQFPGA